MLAAILGGGPTSRLYQSLVVDKKLASSAGAYYSGYSRGPGTFGVYATPRDGVSFDTLETAMDQIIRSMTTTPPEAGEFERAKTRLVAEYTYQQDNQFQLAQDYGQCAHRSGSPSPMSRIGRTASARCSPPTCRASRRPIS